jgi:hypothetical protein
VFHQLSGQFDRPELVRCTSRALQQLYVLLVCCLLFVLARFALTSSSSYKDLPDAGWKAALAQLHDDYFYK